MNDDLFIVTYIPFQMYRLYSVPNFGSCYCLNSNPRKTCRPFREHKRLQLEVPEVFGKDIDVQVFPLQKYVKTVK